MAVSLTQFNANTKAQSALVNQNFQNISDHIRPTYFFPVTGTVTVGTNVTSVYIVPMSMTIEKVYLYTKTGPTGAALIIDIKKNGTSIWSINTANRGTIADGATSGNQTAFDTVSLSDGDILSLDVIQVGSTIAGADLTVALKCS